MLRRSFSANVLSARAAFPIFHDQAGESRKLRYEPRHPAVITLRVQPNLFNQINVICPVQSLQQKYSSSHLPPNQRHNSRRLIPHEGTYPDRQTRRGEMRWTRQRRARTGSQGGLRSVSEQPA